MVTPSAVCVMVNSNGLTCPAIGFCGRQVPDRFGGVCARPLITTNAARTRDDTARFISSSFKCNRRLRSGWQDYHRPRLLPRAPPGAVVRKGPPPPYNRRPAYYRTWRAGLGYPRSFRSDTAALLQEGTAIAMVGDVIRDFKYAIRSFVRR